MRAAEAGRALHRQFFEPSREAGRAARWEPPVDVFETERQLWIIAALPGVAPEAVRVEIEGDLLIIAGTRPLPSKGRNANIVRLEIPYGCFERRVALSPRLRLSAAGAPPWLSRADLCQGRLIENEFGSLSRKDMNEIEKPIQSTEARETIVAAERARRQAAPPRRQRRSSICPKARSSSCRRATPCCFPGIVAPLTLGRPQSIAGAQAAAKADKPVGVMLQKDASVETPGPEHLHGVGTVCRDPALRDLSRRQPSFGRRAARGASACCEFLPGYPFLVARVDEVGEAEVYSTEIAARMHQLKERAREAISLLPNVPTEIAGAIEQIQSPSQLADFIANVSDLTPSREAGRCWRPSMSTERLDKLLRYLAQQIEVLRLSKQIGEQTQEELSGRQREHILREQLRQIQKELGEGEEGKAEIAELREAIDKAGMSEEAEKQALKELKRLERMPEASAEHGMIRSYLDWLIELPWSKTSEDRIDIAEARRILDEDHYGLPKVKQRILEYLAVRKLKPEGKSPILCFVGPPGVGKTSLGQSIARAMGRKFGRISLGGVHDEAEIRGHRRTYIGALPGNIIQAIRKAETRNPVMMLDEMDKLGASYQGDPSAALLEVLDPEQNSTFRDNYLGGAVRPVAGDVHRHGQRARQDSRAVARPHGGDRAPRLYRGGEGRDRQALSGASGSSPPPA